MDQIRPFVNADLPDIAELWIRHWAAAKITPAVSVAMMEQAIFSRTFFQAEDLLIARRNDQTVGWCHVLPQIAAPSAEPIAIIAAICFSPEGLPVCDLLLMEAETQAFSGGHNRVEVGPLRDSVCGYGGLAPVGHGIGVPTCDARVASLLSRRGYSSGRSVERLMVATSPYRPPVNREWMQMRRTTRIEHQRILPVDPHTASALAHLDIEHYRLVDHRSGSVLASVDLWTSDPEAQVMGSAEAILNLDAIHVAAAITSDEGFLISSLIQSLANRRIFSVQTAVDSSHTALIEQLGALGLKTAERGHRWTKTRC